MKPKLSYIDWGWLRESKGEILKKTFSTADAAILDMRKKLDITDDVKDPLGDINKVGFVLIQVKHDITAVRALV